RAEQRSGAPVENFVEDLAHRIEVRRVGHHRNEDPQVLPSPRGEDRGKLGSQRFRRLEQQPDSARVSASDEGRGLVTAEVKQADRGWTSQQSVQDRFQELGLPLERRPRSRIEKRQLGSQQADALGSLLESLDRLSHGRRVYQ